MVIVAPCVLAVGMNAQSQQSESPSDRLRRAIEIGYNSQAGILADRYREFETQRELPRMSPNYRVTHVDGMIRKGSAEFWVVRSSHGGFRIMNGPAEIELADEAKLLLGSLKCYSATGVWDAESDQLLFAALCANPASPSGVRVFVASLQWSVRSGREVLIISGTDVVDSAELRVHEPAQAFRNGETIELASVVNGFSAVVPVSLDPSGNAEVLLCGNGMTELGRRDTVCSVRLQLNARVAAEALTIGVAQTRSADRIASGRDLRVVRRADGGYVLSVRDAVERYRILTRRESVKLFQRIEPGIWHELQREVSGVLTASSDYDLWLDAEHVAIVDNVDFWVGESLETELTVSRLEGVGSARVTTRLLAMSSRPTRGRRLHVVGGVIGPRLIYFDWLDGRMRMADL